MRIDSATKAAIRASIAEGKSKNARDSAKQVQKSAPTESSLALLLDAYEARIVSLCEAGVLQPLGDPQIDPQERARIELRIRAQVTDLEDSQLRGSSGRPLASGCAAAVSAAFRAVTSERPAI